MPETKDPPEPPVLPEDPRKGSINEPPGSNVYGRDPSEVFPPAPDQGPPGQQPEGPPGQQPDDDSDDSDEEDPDELEEEIEAAKEDGDVEPRKRSKTTSKKKR